ncbi:MAG: alpha/beta fold hydrolase [Selenomonadaceae bacterium]|nr:alpha/beta fold hydrolase [Selenomonadaceae bacterium]
MMKFLFALILLIMPFTASAQSQNISIDGDHCKLSAVLQTPDAQKKYPLVIICHGFTANKEHLLLTSLADDLETRGIASIRFDFNGHGQSDGDFQDMTVLNEIEDAKKVYEYASRLPNVTSISIAGHSQGGVVASMVAGELGAKKIKAVVLMAPAAVLRDDALRGNLFGVNFDALNPPEAIQLKMPHGNFNVGRNYVLTAQTLPIYETAEKFTGPALMIHGTGDIIVPYTYSLSYKKVYKHGEIKLLDGVDHSFHGDEARTAKIAADFFAAQLKK